MKIRNITDSSHATVAPISETSANVSRPEFFRLPATGGDRFFGLTRSFYYEGENRGYWRLVRLRERGKQRGVTLIPFDAVADFVREQMQKDGPRHQGRCAALASRREQER
jgi:hypothetical protein